MLATLAVVRDGDEIEIDLTRRVLGFAIYAEELAARLAGFTPPDDVVRSGWLANAFRVLKCSMLRAAWFGQCRFRTDAFDHGVDVADR